MRDFFIRSMEMVINVVVVIMAIGILAAAGIVAFADPRMTHELGVDQMGPMHQYAAGGGPIVGLMILIGGMLYLCLVAGFLYLGLGIYHNTRRAAEILEGRYSR